MVRNSFAVVLGIVVGMTLNMMLIQLNSHVFFPMPPGTDVNDPAQFNAYIAGLPHRAFIVVLLAHLGQSFVGAWVAARLGTSHRMKLALSVGVVSLIGGVLAMGMIDGPDWLVVELPLYLVVAWLAGSLVEDEEPG